MRKYPRILFAIIGLGGLMLQANAQMRDVVEIDVNSRGDKVYPTMYGAFFEEISHAGDGGLYAEMVKNRGFEEGVIPSGCTLVGGEVWAPKKPCYTTDKVNNWRIRWNEEKKAMEAWTVEAEKGTAEYEISTIEPLNAATPHSLRLMLHKTNGKVTVANSGYWGMAVEAGENYILRFFVHSNSQKPVKVSAVLTNANGEVTKVKTETCQPKRFWEEHKTVLKATKTAADCRLELRFEGDGDVYLDYVSLFPEKTYNNRENGLRKDIAQYLVDMHPSFLRWPGGCILEGINIENAVDWKKTLGDPMTRPGEYDLWGYRNTYGFGYHEFLQFCEDANIDPMYVCNAGMSCLFRGGDYVEGDSLRLMIQDCLDAIEYAIGDESTFWGHQRAVNGHPKPFPLRYVEIGNENVGPRYAEHYKLFRDAIRKKYPQLEIICALMFHPEIPDCGDMDLFDPHYYENADWFYRAANVFDEIPEQYKSNIYVGEYAAGGANMYAALAEAAFLTGCERNGERVRMTSFAPLFQNIHNGTRHLICYDNSKVFGRSNYHMVKMFNENRPDYNLTTKINPSMRAIQAPNFPSGKIGISTFGNEIEIKDFVVGTTDKATDKFTILYQNKNPLSDVNYWSLEEDGNDKFYWMGKTFEGNYTIAFRMKKNSGKEACRLMFGGKDTKNFYMAELGSHQNESTIFGERKNGDYTNYFNYRNVEKINEGQWYYVTVDIAQNEWKIYLDGRLVEDYTLQPLVRHYAVAGLDENKNDVIVKLVNGENREWALNLDLKGKVNGVAEAEVITISADSPNQENSIDNPDLIVPRKEHRQLTFPKASITLPANSLTILRIKK